MFQWLTLPSTPERGRPTFGYGWATKAQARLKVCNTSAITGDLANVDPSAVEAFLIRNLRWRALLTQSDTDLGAMDPLNARVTVHVNSNLSCVWPGSFELEELDFCGVG